VEIAPGSAPPAQPSERIVNEIKKVRTGKKPRKCKKVSQSQQPKQSSIPWPPRSKSVTNLVSQAGGFYNRPLQDPGNISQLETQNGQTHGPVRNDARAKHPIHEHPAPTYSQNSTSRNVQANEDFPNEAKSCDTLQNMPSITSQSLPGSSADSVLPRSPATASSLIVEQLHVAKLDEHSLKTLQDQSDLKSNQQVHVTHSRDQCATSSTQELHRNYIPHIAQSLGTMAAVPPQPSQPHGRKNAGQSREAEVVLHGVSGQRGSDRVNKSRQKTRVISGPPSYASQGSSVFTVFEQSLQSLKLGMLADSFRIQHEQTTAKNQYEKTIMQLQSSVRVHETNAALWEEKYKDSCKVYSRMAEGAKNNQKFLAGLQNDFEKLQKFVEDFKGQNSEALQGKIAEIEDEKKILRHEFEMTTEKLMSSLQKVRKVAEDLYLKFVVSESKNRDLIESLNKQNLSCKAAEEKRDNLEKQLLSFTKDAQSQLEDRFKTLTSKVMSLHLSAEEATADGRQKLNTEECLDILRGLKATNFLKAIEVQSMLHPVNKQ